ncbi:MAG: hypothetical protein AAGF10_06245 [Verrucomicrobiota bacterium]
MAEDFDAREAVLGTWVFAEEDSLNRLRASQEWLSMTPEQQLEYRTTVWPKALNSALFTAYHFKPDELVTIFKQQQTDVPLNYVSSAGSEVQFRIGSGSSAPLVTITFINPNRMMMKTGDKVNYIVWKRVGQP